MLQIRPVSDLRNKFPDIEKIVNAGEPVYLTKNGYGAMVVLSLEEYSKLTDGVEAALNKAERYAAEDLDEKVTYIAEKLKNPKAAIDLLDKVESAIMERLPLAESSEPYHSVRERRYSYYRIYVDNYIIYYVVIDDDPNDLIMEVRRFLYNGQNRGSMV